MDRLSEIIKNGLNGSIMTEGEAHAIVAAVLFTEHWLEGGGCGDNFHTGVFLRKYGTEGLRNFREMLKEG